MLENVYLTQAESKPGHEYTKSNVKFCMSVLQSEAVKALSAFADKNQETQGKFTIGDEKKHNVFMRPQVRKSQSLLPGRLPITRKRQQLTWSFNRTL